VEARPSSKVKDILAAGCSEVEVAYVGVDEIIEPEMSVTARMAILAVTFFENE
jgi:hypothetical protein